jgi:serine/threonine protein kinase
LAGVKLIDFGFAERVNYQRLICRAGTPGYIAPELFRGKPYTEKADVYSLGIVLYSVQIYITNTL